MAMMFNYCRVCGSSPYGVGTGRVKDPKRKWFEVWKTITCPACGGDGKAKPPGWPDKKEIERLRPSAMPKSPPKV